MTIKRLKFLSLNISYLINVFKKEITARRKVNKNILETFRVFVRRHPSLNWKQTIKELTNHLFNTLHVKNLYTGTKCC